jgi:hypothetical protein
MGCLYIIGIILAIWVAIALFPYILGFGLLYGIVLLFDKYDISLWWILISVLIIVISVGLIGLLGYFLSTIKPILKKMIKWINNFLFVKSKQKEANQDNECETKLINHLDDIEEKQDHKSKELIHSKHNIKNSENEKKTQLPPPKIISYEKAMEYISNKEYSKGLEILRKMASQGDKKSQNKLGDMYSSGDGVKINEKEANKWYKLAEEKK